MNILLIDKRVSRYEDIVAAIDPALAVGIVFDYFEDTFDTLKVRIRDVGTTTTTTTTNTSGTSVSVGLVQHNYRVPMFSMLASTAEAETKCTVSRVESLDPNLATWAQFKEFIVWCKSELNTAHFDMMACALYSDPNWKYVIDTLSLPSQTGITIRASTDNTGAATQGGNWFLESHTGVNLKGVYFTELINEYKGLLILEPYNRNYPTKSFAVGDAILWFPWTITIPDVVAIYFTETAVAALKSNGSVLNADGNIVVSSSSGVIAVYSTNVSFAAIKSDGSVICWTDLGDGSSISPTTISNSGVVVSIYSTQYAFAALKSDGSIVAWGDPFMGGEAPTTVTNANSGVVAVYSTYGAFAALKSDGSVIAWGDSSQGGEAPTTVTAANSGVVTVYSTGLAFAALKTNGSIVAWGDSTYGGLAPSTVTAANSGVVAVYSAQLAFAALKSDGGVVAWGDSFSGGDSSLVASSLLSGVVAVYSNSAAFAALKADGSVVAWGSEPQGGSAPITVTSANSGVVAVYSTDGGAFAALKSNGSLVVWGYDLYGGATGWASSSLTSDVVAVYSVYDTFAALKNDGSIVAWNMAGSYASVAPSTVTNANSGVVAVYSYSSLTFAAIKTTATTFDLSASYYSNMDRYNILRKKENRRRANLTTSNNNVFTLSNATDIKLFNPNIPAGKTFSIIVPAYAASSSYSITSTATIPSGAGNFIVACDDSEPVTISGATYVNFGSYVYKRETNNTYTKLTTATIGGTVFTLYGGDGINSSGIALVNSASSLPVPTLSTFSVPASKTYGDASFNITTAPTSASNGAITYTSNATGVATINASTGVITLVSAGTVTFTASQAATAQYSTATKTSNTLTVALLAPTLSTFAVESTKRYGDASFNITAPAPTSASNGAITYSSNTPGVATINASTGVITIVSAGTVTFTASQAATAQYSTATKTSNTLTVSLLAPTLSTFAVAASKTYGDASFNITTAPTSASNGAITYSSNTPSVATINASTGVITLVSAGTVTFTATQAATSQYSTATVTSNTLTVSLLAPTLSTFTVESTKRYGDASFNITAPAPTSASNGAITYSSNTPSVATINASTGVITLVSAGTVTFTASQAATSQYSTATVTSNTLTVSLLAPTLSTFAVAASKTYGDASFNITTAPTSASNGAITYTSNATGVATINASTGVITLVSAGTVTFTASQAETAQYNATNVTSNELTVALGATSLTAFSVAETKTYGDQPFSIAVPTISRAGAITYGSNNISIATIDASTGLITLVSAGTVTFTASQAETTQYEAGSVTSNELTIALGTPILSAFAVPALNAYGAAPFGVSTPAPTSASNGAITYSSNAPSVATINASTGVITVLIPGTVTFTASQAAVPGKYVVASAVTSNAMTVTLAEQTVTSGTSFAGADLSGASLSGATLNGVSFAGASLVNANFSGATVAGTNFTNANISGATNLPAFSTTQKLQLLRNTNNVNISAVQISTPLSGAEINAAITIPIPAIAGGTFVVKAPTYNASNEKVVTVATGDIADRSSIYIPLNSGETVKVNGAAYTFNGTNVLDSNSNIVTTLNVLGVPFMIYVGSIIMLNSSLRTPTITAFTVASSKILSNPAFAITARPASNSGGAITYSSNNPSVATIDAAGNLITLQSVGTVTFLASQAEVPDEYAAITVTSNVLTVSPAILPTPVLSSFIVASKKSIGDAAFAITTRPASASNGAITYTSNAGIATIDASGNWITVVGAGAATFTAFQEAVPGEWNSATITSNVLRVPNGPVCAPMNRWFSATNAPRANSSDRISALRARELTRDGTITIASLEGPTDPAPPVNSDWVKIITPQGDPSVVNRLALNSAGASNALLLLSPPQKPM